MRFGLTTRVMVTVLIILAAGVGMTTLLSARIFERTLSELLTSRMEFKVNEFRHRIETQMDLGIALSDLRGISEMLDEYRQTDKQILSIEVFDERGVVLFSTDSSFAGDLVTEAWVTQWRSGRERLAWSHLDRDARVIGISMQDNLGRNVGSLALRYSRNFFDDNVAAQTVRLLIIGTAVILCMIPVCILGAVFLLRGLRMELRRFCAILDNLPDRHRDGRVSDPVRARHPKLAAFVATALAAHDDMDTAIAEIRQLDEDEIT